jgi:GPH family glycoside/pentoside/hexuronide:cation symporter
VFGAFGDVLRNPHARRLLLVQCSHFFSVAVLSLVSAYVFQYVLRVPSGTAALLVACFAVGVVAAIPLWVMLSKRFGKHRCWSAALWALGALYTAIFFVLDAGVSSSGASFAVTAAATLLLGALQSSNFVLSHSMQADVIDWDELRTGERKEGAYLATWSFGEKCASALAAALVGVALEWVGYAPNAVQSDAVRLMILGLMSFAPAVCHVVSALLLMGFGLGEQEHARIREVLASQPRGGAARSGEGAVGRPEAGR